MRFFCGFVFLSILLGCGSPSGENSTKVNQFREDVLKLNQYGMMKQLTPVKMDSLISVYSKDSINGLKEILAATGDLLKINVSLNGRSLKEVYQRITDTIGMKYPELKCDEVTSEILPNKPGGNDTGWVLVKIRFGEKWYERKLYYFDNWQIDDFVYRIYNRKLADDGSKKRLHLVEYNCTDCKNTQDDFMGSTDVTRYGYMMLNKSTAESLMTIDALEMEQENEFSIFTTAQMTTELSKFEASGLIDAVGKKWYDNVKTDVMQSAIYQQKDFYDYFDTLFSTTIFDTSNIYNPYEEVLSSMSKISRGNFVPTAITDDEGNGNSRTVQFNYQGDVYKFDAEQRGAYLFPGIIDNVNKSLDDHHAGGAFYTIYTEGDFCMLVYIDNDKAEKANSSGFFKEFRKGPSQELKDRWTNAPAL